MKKNSNTIFCLLIAIVVLSSCTSAEKFISRGYSYNVVSDPIVVEKVWMPGYFRYYKKQQRYRFISGHYRFVLNRREWAHRQVRQRNRAGTL